MDELVLKQSLLSDMKLDAGDCPQVSSYVAFRFLALGNVKLLLALRTISSNSNVSNNIMILI